MPDVILPHEFQDNVNMPASGQEVMDNLNAIKAVVEALDGDNYGDATIAASKLDASLAALLGISSGGVVRRGKAIIPTEEGRTNAAYGLMTTPDRVQGVVVPSGGLLRVKYSALIKASTSGNADATIFVGSNQVRTLDGSSTVPVVWNPLNSLTVPTDYDWIYTDPSSDSWMGTEGSAGGLQSARDANPVIAGGFIDIEVDAGTYDVSVQFAAFPSGTVTVKERRLYVEAVSF